MEGAICSEIIFSRFAAVVCCCDIIAAIVDDETAAGRRDLKVGAR